MNLLEEVRQERNALHSRGVDYSLATATENVCRRLGMCPRCKLGAGTIIARWDQMRPIIVQCPRCKGTGVYVQEEAEA